MTESKNAIATFKISVGKNRYATLGDVDSRTVTYDEFTELLIPRKINLSHEEFMALPEEKRAAKKDKGWFQAGESDTERRWPLSRWAVTIDLDSADTQTAKKIAKLYSKYHYWLYETAKSTEEEPRYRLVIPFEYAIDLDQHKALATLICYEVGLEFCDVVTSTKAASLFYWPVCFTDKENLATVNEGNVFDPLVYLDNVWQHHFEGEYTDMTTWPGAKPQPGAISSSHTPKNVQAIPQHKVGKVGNFCRTYSIVDAIEKFLSDIWMPTKVEKRYTYVGSTTTGGGVIYAGERGDEDESFFHSFHATDPYNNMQLNAFDLVRLHRFGGLDVGKKINDPMRLPSYKSMMELVADDPKIAEHVSKEVNQKMYDDTVVLFPRAEGKSNTAKKPEPKPTPKSDTAKHAEQNNPWYDAERPFRFKIDNNANGKYEVTQKNLSWCVGALVGKDVLAYNRRLDAVVVRAGISHNKRSVIAPVNDEDTRCGRRLTDAEESFIISIIEDAYPWKKLPLSRSVARDAVRDTANLNTFDPVVDYLEALPKWDGKTKCDNVLCKYIKGIDNSKWTKKCTRFWMMAAVARALNPGCKVEQVIVLYGAEGKGKSTTFERICPSPKDLFSDQPKVSEGAQKFAESIAGRFIVELGELDEINKTRAAQLKSFLSTRSETFRAAYGHHASNRPRDFIFYGTCNDADWLRKEMSMRRWLPIKVTTEEWTVKEHAKLMKHLDKYKDQYWAHALHLYRKHGLAFPNYLRKNQLQHTNKVLTDTPFDSLVARCRDWISNEQPKRTCVTEVVGRALNTHNPGRDALERRAAQNALNELGYQRPDSRAKITQRDSGAKFMYIDQYGQSISVSCVQQHAYQKESL